MARIAWNQALIMRNAWLAIAGCGIAWALAVEAVRAQDYPAKVIRIVTSPPGGSNDFAARLLVRGFAERPGWQFVVDNRPTIVAPEVVMRAAPDGYTLLVSGGTFITGPLIEKMPYEPLKDFAPISLTHRQTNVLVVHPSLPVKSVKDLIALAQARPGQLNYGSSGTGSASHLSGELFKVMTGTKIVRINFKGLGGAVTSLLSGEVQLMYANPAAIAPYLQAGRVRALAITSAQPSPLHPRLPTLAASGLPGFEMDVITAVYAPSGAPVAIVSRLNTEIVRAINVADVKEKFTAIGIETVGSSPQELTAWMKGEIARTSRLVKEGSIRGE